MIDEHTRECLAIDVARKLRNDDLLEQLAWLMATRTCLHTSDRTTARSLRPRRSAAG